MEKLQTEIFGKEKNAISLIEKTLSANSTYSGKISVIRHILKKFDNSVDELVSECVLSAESRDLPF